MGGRREAQPGNRYRNLVSNTLLFGVSTFGSKLMAFVMMPIYTRILDAGAYGLHNVITSTCVLIVPIMSLCVHEAVIRFGMEKGYRRRDIFTSSVLVILAGYAVLLLSSPLLRRGLEFLLAGESLTQPLDEVVALSARLILIYTLTSALRSTVISFVRSGGFTRLFALDGIVTTVMTALLSVIFLTVFNMGVTGIVLGTIVADAFSSVSLILLLRLYRFFSLRGLRRPTLREMLRYCVPLMPTGVFWWVTNLSDHYFVSYMVGLDANGLYTVSASIPRIITLVSTVFIQAWQLSAFDEYGKEDGARFYSTVFRSYCTVVFLAASMLILLVKPLTIIISDPQKYYESWRCVPFLLLAVSFSCLVTFLGTIYNAAKKNGMVTLTTLLGAGANILLNAALIPIYGAAGAAFATFISYLLVFVIRAVDSRRYIAIRMRPVKTALILALLLLQCWVALTEVSLWVLWECLIFLLILLCNLQDVRFLIVSTLRLLPSTSKKRA